MVALTPLLQHVDRVLKSTSIEGIWQMHCAQLQGYGFDRLLFISTRFRTHGIYGNMADAMVLSSHPAAFVDAFLNDGLYKFAPNSNLLRTHHGMFSWPSISEIAAANPLPSNKGKLMRLYQKWNISAGYTVALKPPDQRSVSAFGLCARPGLDQNDVEEIWAKSGTEIYMLCSLAQLKLSTLPHSGQRTPLTARQKEVMGWVAEGKPVRDIASILQLSTATIEKHLRQVRQTLDVETTMQAIQKIAMQEQLYLIDDIKLPGAV